MTSRSNKRKSWACLGALCAQALLGGCRPPEPERRVAVVVAARDLAAGQVLEPALLGTAWVAEVYAGPGVLRPESLPGLGGRRLAVALPRGVPLADAELEPASLAAGTAKGARRVSVAAAGAEEVHPGDRIDLLVTAADPATHEAMTLTLLQRVPVAAVSGGTLALDLLPGEAEVVIQARAIGTLTAALRNPEDLDVQEERGRATLTTLLTGERIHTLLKKRQSTIQVIKGTGEGQVYGWTPPAEPVSNTEEYKDHGVNGWAEAQKDHLSTFSVDVDTASYAIARRKVLEGARPPPQEVRVEEFLNYFTYDYPGPAEGPFAVHLDAAPSPYAPGRHLLRVGLQGRRLSAKERKHAHLTFLVDTSGSMQDADKLPWAKRALRYVVDNLQPGDTVALTTYAGNVSQVLPPTGMEQRARIYEAIEGLASGGGTAMASGIELAYRNAMKGLTPDSNSRVIVLSDGDANIGTLGAGDILKSIHKYAEEGITLTTVGFGQGNYKDARMEELADKGNGNYFYIDSLLQAERVFQNQLGGTLEVIAKDVKLQVDFDPAKVRRYRLLGYENRDIADRDFRNDRVDAGEVGSGHSVTALYEVELAPGAAVDGLCTVRVRAKAPRGEEARETAYAFRADQMAPTFDQASPDLRFAAAVAGYAEVLRQSPYARGWTLDQVREIARAAAPQGSAERQEFVTLVEAARRLPAAPPRLAQQ